MGKHRKRINIFIYRNNQIIQLGPGEALPE